ncbi:MAG TPA: hypothetical protein VLI41_12790 [Phenylobacterium sp.]|uniref:hypothetical protein n=1 Tax=Phenylobacterium sp. TaxID=1871053 RepID=UPI002B6061D9|nr:hypothetical protein [Phenylobacterium sp.]HSV04071.1 hypothetical protein [Phenylobacterium sp.]
MLLAMLAVLAASTPAAPEGAAPAPAPAATARAPAKKKDDVICRTEQVTGSMFPKKVCRSKAESARQTAEQQQQIRHDQRLQTSMGH